MTAWALLIMVDEAILPAWAARYEGPGGECCDVAFYVYGDVIGGYGVVEHETSYRLDDKGWETDHKENDRGLDQSFSTPTEALRFCRRLAMSDDRWKLQRAHAG